MVRPLIVLGVLLSLGFAPAPFLKKKAPSQSDLERMQGAWTYPGGSELRVQGDSYTYYRNGAPVIGYKITLNETTTPRQYDLKGVGKWASRTFHGIYEFQGETLKMYSVQSSRPRPTTFPPGNPRAVKAFTRIKR
jgi:uncharacterized protein (TIGR03067 family)